MSPRAHRRLSLLALAAMLLLALLPTVGRLAGMGPAAGCGDAGGAPSMSMAMSMPGMDSGAMTPAEHRAHMAAMAAVRAPASPVAPTGHDGHDCPYCPLLSGLDTAAMLPWTPHAPAAIGPWSVRAVVARAMDAPVPALGAQGPPPAVA